MKKLLIAAAIAAITAPAMAQVSLYGVLDGSVNVIKNASATADTTSAFIDGAVTSSLIGFRGSEDLGGGKRAIFQVESDVQVNNGGTHQSGMFRRAAYAGLQTGAGELTLGLRLNPVIATQGRLMPLAGNSFNSTIAGAFNYADFYTKNAVTYTTPRVAGITAQAQYGFSNTTDIDAQGTVVAGSLLWEMGPLTLTAAGQDRRAGGTTSSANASATAAQGDVTTWLAGAQYKITPALTAGAGYVRNDIAGLVKTNMQFGAAYSLTKATSVGVNYMKSNSEDNSLLNVQARYALSKRTTIYTQVAQADNGALSAIRTLNTNTGTSPAANVSGFVGVPNVKQTAAGVGLIHSF